MDERGTGAPSSPLSRTGIDRTAAGHCRRSSFDTYTVHRTHRHTHRHTHAAAFYLYTAVQRAKNRAGLASEKQTEYKNVAKHAPDTRPAASIAREILGGESLTRRKECPALDAAEAGRD